jgi:hypothetical protein
MSESQSLDSYRLRATELISRAGDSVDTIAEEYRAVVKDFLAAGGSSTDMIVKIGEQFFPEKKIKSLGPQEDDPIPGSRRLDFDYLEQFMIDSFLAIGVPEKEARIAADVLIESDKRGIDSHGVGRLKPIYFDRIKKGILKPYAPIDILKETNTTALVDGNMGLGLYIGPYW